MCRLDDMEMRMPDAGQTTGTPTPRIHPAPALAPVPPRAGPRSARRAGRLLVVVLGGLSALPPLSTDMYLPALPAVTRSLHTTASTAQATLTACLVGMALGQIVIGPMSDKWGRRRPLLLGMVVYVVTSAVCALAPNAGIL